MNIDALQAVATSVRTLSMDGVQKANSGHPGLPMGVAEVGALLYGEILNHHPGDSKWLNRDRFILSKGHCTPVIYSILADCGYFPTDDLRTFRRPGSHLQGHPYAPKTPGIEASTGTLGLGLSTACGMALAAKLNRESQKYYVLCGDGETQEGQIWEAAMFANKYRLHNLITIIDRNYLQTDGHSEQIMPLEPFAAKWEAFGWEVFEIDGHDYSEIISTFKDAKQAARPVVIIAHTTKGKGVPFMEGDYIWHGKPPDQNEYKTAMDTLYEIK